jgi:hypothetical protein
MKREGGGGSTFLERRQRKKGTVVLERESFSFSHYMS